MNAFVGVQRTTLHALVNVRVLSSRPWVRGLALLMLATSIYQVRQASDGAPYAFSAEVGARAAVDDARLFVAFSCLGLSAVWMAMRRGSSELRRDAHLEGRQPRELVWGTLLAIVSVTGAIFAACVALASLAAGTIFAHPIDAPPGVPDKVFSAPAFEGSWEAVAMTFFAWTSIGVAIGWAARRTTTAATGAAVVATGSILLERLATTNTLALDVHAILPLGLTNAGFTGQGVPDYPPSEFAATRAGVLLLLWGLAALVAVLAVTRSATGWRDANASASIRRIKHGGVATGLLVTCVVYGGVVPAVVGDHIPWHLRLVYRNMESSHTTPADFARRTLEGLLADDLEAVHAGTTAAVEQQVRELRPLLDGAGGEFHVENVTSAEGPGSVVVNVGRDRVNADGSIQTAPQVGLCLVPSGSSWRIDAISLSGVTCQ